MSTKRDTTTIRKVAHIHDKATDKHFEVIKFPTSQSTQGSLQLQPSVVSKRSAFENELRDAGAILPKNKGDLKDLLTAVADTDASEEWIYETRTGWTGDRRAFVVVDGAIGNPETKVIGVSRPKEASDHSGQLSTAGMWTAWRDSVASVARLSTTLMCSVSVAFAVPLLAITNRQSFTINLFGRSRSGKTMATLMSASVIGTARIEDLITWNITDAGLEERLVEFNDTVFPIDDLGHIKDSKEKYLRIRKLAYIIAHGAPTGRHSSFTASHGGKQQGWRSIALTSNEKSIRDLARASKAERQHGEALRLIDVPAVFDGLPHIFDLLPADLDTGNFQDWERDTFKKIVDGCEENHGKAFQKYIRALIADHDELKAYVEEKISIFLNEACGKFDGDVARDVAEKFGLIYAGGLLGIRYKLLPWEESQLLSAVKKAFLAARLSAWYSLPPRSQGLTGIRPRSLATGTDRLWTEPDLASVLSIASPEMELTVLLALGTGQRQGDLLRLRWSDYDGKHIRLRQSKTGQADVVVRIGVQLKARLDEARRRGPLMLTNTRGRPWTSDGFRTSWAKLCQRAGIENLTFHDLRGSAVTRLALAGATPQEIAGVTGHSLADVGTILDRHYLGDRAALAENAIRRLERKRKRTKTVNRV